VNNARISSELFRIARTLCAVDYKTHRDKLQELIKTRPDIPVMEGDTSHEGKWHYCSVLGHIDWTRKNAEAAYKAAGIDVREVAALHDIGKIISARLKSDGTFSFKGHEISGAEYLKNERKWNSLTDEDIEIIGNHGSFRKGIDHIKITGTGLRKLAALELCDEFAKWSKEKIPDLADMEVFESNRQMVIDGAAKILGSGTVDKIVKAFSECI